MTAGVHKQTAYERRKGESVGLSSISPALGSLIVLSPVGAERVRRLRREAASEGKRARTLGDPK